MKKNIQDYRNEKLLTAQIINIEWDRIYLILDVKVDFTQKEITDLEFFIVNSLYKTEGKFQVLQYHQGIYKLKINITNNGENCCYAVGTYNIYICKDEKFFGICALSPKMANQLETASRNFLYANRNKVYTVNFFVKDNDEGIIFEMYILASSKCEISFPKFGKFRSIFFHTFQDVKKYLTNGKIFYRKYYYRKRKRLKGKSSKKTLLFMSEQNDKLGANLTAVKDRLIQRGMDHDFCILTSARMASSVKQSIRSWNDLVKKIAQSDIIFLDDHAPIFDWLVVDKDTKIIQLWHAGVGFKATGYSRWGHKGGSSPLSCHRQYTYGIAGSENARQIFAEIWGINNEQVIPTGLPRMDKYLDKSHKESKIKELKEKISICNGKKVILFAPTYRGVNRKDAHYPYNLIDFHKLYEICGEEYIVLFKMHPWVKDPVPIEENYKDKFLDVSGYEDINDLFYITDLLITDYSSNIFEYSLMKKPAIFFAFDKVQYSFSRGFHRDYENFAPGKVCYNFYDLLRAIEEQDFESEKMEKYVQYHFDYVDNHSTDRVIDWLILEKMPINIKEKLIARIQENNQVHDMDFKCINKEAEV